MSGAPGPDGRGADLLEALKAKNRRPREETPAASDGAVAAPPPAGRAAILPALEIKSAAESKTPVGAAAAAEPPLAPVQPKGRVALLAKLKAAATSAPGQPATQAAPSHLSPPSSESPKSSDSPKTPSPTQVSPERSSPAGQAAAELDKMQIKSPVVRKGEGGKKVSLTANYVRLEVEKGKGVFEYEVRFSPPVDSKNERFKCLNQHRNIIGPAKMFDGVVLFIPFQLPDHKTQLQSEHPNDGSPVTVTITLKHHKRMGDRDCIQLYNVLFNRVMNSLKMCMINRNFYDPRNGHMIPQHKLEVWPGYVTAVQEFEDGIMLNCDVSHRVLHTQTVRDHLVDIHKMGKDNFKANAQKALIGSIVITRYNNRCYRVDDIDFDSTPSSTFTDYTGKETSFVEYYKRQYNIDIKDLKQPMLLHREKKKAQEGHGVTRLICLVPELTFMTGLTDSMKADFRVMKDVAMYTRVTPNQCQLSIKKFIQNINSSEEASAHLRCWGLKLSPTLEG